MASMKDAALAYAERGWPVFPCRADKAPYMEGGVLEATTNPDQILEWWSEFPRANIGFHLGEVGLMVLDLDPGHDWDEIEGSVGPVPDTHLVARTPRGGEHLYLALDSGEVVPPSSNKVAPHVDVRSWHSYVLLPPSRTADGEYRWEEQGKAAYRTDAIVAKAGEARAKSQDRDEWIIEPDLPENVDLCVKWLRNDARIAVEGAGGDMVAYSTAAMCKSYGMSPENAFDLMWQHWNGRCDPPWSEDQIDHLEAKVAHAYSYNTSPPGNMTPAYKVAKQAELFKPVVSRDPTEEGGGTSVEVGRFRFVDERGIEKIEPPAWLIENTLPVGGYGLLAGPSGTYKTFIALDMALSIATGGRRWYEDGEDWLGCWPDTGREGLVMFAAGEGRGGFRSRVNAWRQHHIEGEFTERFVLVDPVPRPEEEDVEAFISGADSLAGTRDISLVVLDTIGRSMQGLNENTQQDASRFTQAVEAIQRELGCAVLAIHHTGHEASDRPRGSTVFFADADTVLLTEKVDDYVRLRMLKQKDAAEWEGAKLIKLEAHAGSLVCVTAGEEAERKVSQRPEPKESKRQARGGRKAPGEKEVELELIREVAYQVMQAYPQKEWSKSQLADAIAADERIEVAPNTLRTHYLGELLTDKKHPVARCFDRGKGRYVFHGGVRAGVVDLASKRK